MRVIVSGWVASFPTAPYLWHPLSFLLGFRALGHDVWFLDDPGDYPMGWNLQTGEEDPFCSYGIDFLHRELAELGLDDRWIFRHAPTNSFAGLDEEAARDAMAEADLLVDVSMVLPMRDEYLRIPHRLGIDTDPVFTQIGVAQRSRDLDRTHTRLYTFGRPPLPAQRHEWIPTRQPFAADLWPVAPPPEADAPFTTVASWQAFEGAARWQDEIYRLKDASLLAFATLPALVSAPVAIALGGGHNVGEGRRIMRAHGWQVSDAIDHTRSTEAYRSYISGSRGEFGVAKEGYVTARSGWFSERSCAYMATGRAVVAQDTGWSEWLPAGKGLLPFTTIDEAVSAIEAVLSDPVGHGRAARALIEQEFDAATVCQHILDAL